MENICKNHIEEVSNETAMKLILLGSAEMTQSSVSLLLLLFIIIIIFIVIIIIIEYF